MKIAVSYATTHTVRYIRGKRLTLSLSDLGSKSPYCLPYGSHDVSSENLVLDQLIIPQLIFFFILITYLVDIVLIL